MRLSTRFSLPVLLALLLAPGLAARTVVQVKGSDTIGGVLGQDLARSFMASHPDVEVKWEALGSGTAFVGLLDGSAELGAASRAVKDNELAEAKKLGFELREFVIGYDGIAVIVHPANAIGELTLTQLADLFTGKLRNWKDVGGADRPVHLVTRPSYSGTHVFFRDKVLRHGNDKGPEGFAPAAEVIEENGAILQRVAQDRGAISYVGIGWVNAQVRTVPVAPAAGRLAVRAGIETVRTGTYPIYRPLLMYSRGEPRGAARELLSFILSAEGQKVVAKSDFVPSDAPAPLAAPAPPARAGAAVGTGGPAAASTGPGGTEPAHFRVHFPLGGAALDESARDTLDQVAEISKRGGRRLLVAGHADASGSPAANQRVSRARADAVAAYLAGRGVRPELVQIAARGAEEPVASNSLGRSRGQNRRVDVTVLPAGR
jgi:phosphate transport system substrate-binding protein